MKCANCDKPALYVYEGPGIRPLPYCPDDLPVFLQGKARSGALKTTEAYEAIRNQALSALSPIRTYAVDPEPEPSKKRRARKKSEEPAVEEPVEEPVDEPAEEPVEGE